MYLFFRALCSYILCFQSTKYNFVFTTQLYVHKYNLPAYETRSKGRRLNQYRSNCSSRKSGKSNTLQRVQLFLCIASCYLKGFFDDRHPAFRIAAETAVSPVILAERLSVELIREHVTCALSSPGCIPEKPPPLPASTPSDSSLRGRNTTVHLSSRISSASITSLRRKSLKRVMLNS